MFDKIILSSDEEKEESTERIENLISKEKIEALQKLMLEIENQAKEVPK